MKTREEVLNEIERVRAQKSRGIITEEEFVSKKIVILVEYRDELKEEIAQTNEVITKTLQNEYS